MATKKLFARVKASQKFPRMVLFSGHEYVKSEWRRVPAGFEGQAKNDDRVETKLQDVAEEEAAEETPVTTSKPAPERITITDTEEQIAESEGEESDEETSDEEDESEEAEKKPKSRRGSSKAK